MKQLLNPFFSYNCSISLTKQSKTIASKWKPIQNQTKNNKIKQTLAKKYVFTCFCLDLLKGLQYSPDKM